MSTQENLKIKKNDRAQTAIQTLKRDRKKPISKNQIIKHMDLMQTVITTKYVAELNSKIVFAYHSKDGWKFFGAEKDVKESDSRVVSLGNLISSNPLIKNILWIEEGMEAWLNSESDTWQTGVANMNRGYCFKRLLIGPPQAATGVLARAPRLGSPRS